MSETDKQFEHIHVHSDLSNFGEFKHINKVEQLVKRAVEIGQKTFGCTESNNVLDWVKKKQLAESNGLKYWHGVEANVCWDNGEDFKSEREAHHLLLIAKNYDGVLELNEMVSKSFDDEYKYFKPRMSFQMIKESSDNILITTADLNSPLWQYYKNNFTERLKEWTSFIIKNKHRVYLEVQNHEDVEWKMYNKMLLDIHRKYDIPLVASCDVHAIDEEDNTLRKIVSKAKEKKGRKSDEDTVDNLRLLYDDVNTIINGFKSQNVLSEDEINKAIQGTVDLTNQVEEFELDRTPKYPQMNDNPEPYMRKLVLEGYKARGLDKLPSDKQQVYKDRVNAEMAVFRKTNSLQYMLLEYETKKYGRDNDIIPGAGRGSSGGSLISWLLFITDVDPIRWGLSFSRFLHQSRIAPPDIDSDWSGNGQFEIQKHLLTSETITSASIITFGTFGVKAAIDTLGRGLLDKDGEREYSYNDIEDIKSQLIIEGQNASIPEYLKLEYPKLFSKVDKIVGVIQSVGRHAAAIICSSENLRETISTVRVPGWDYPVSAINMDSVEHLQYVKLDVLGVKTLQTYQGAAKKLGLPLPSVDSEYLDLEDPLIWEEARKDTTTLFQFGDGGRSAKVLQDLLEPSTIAKMKELDKEGFSYIKVASVANAGIRPGAKSLIEDLQSGIVKDNGSDIINKMLAESLGYLIFQEQSIAFLQQIANYDDSEADQIRRGIGHKRQDILDEHVPKIRVASIETLTKEYGGDVEKATKVADEFMRIFMDSVNYQFNKSHSIAYSINLAMQLWFRTYHKLAYLTSCLEVWEDKPDKTKLVLEYAERNGIQLKPPTFRYSQGGYFFNEETNSIYQGTAPIKNMNARAGDDLFSLRDVEFNNWLDFLLYIKDGSTITIDGTEYKMHLLYTRFTEDEIKQLDKDIKADPEKYPIKRNPFSSLDKRNMEPLIRLGYFEEFGEPAKLLATYELFLSKYKPNNKTFAGKYKNFQLVKDFWENEKVENFKVAEQLETELYYTGRVTKSFEKIPAKYGFVTAVDVRKTRTTAQVFNIRTGKSVEVKVGSRLFKNVPFEQGDIIEIREGAYKPKSELVAGQWIKSKTKKEYWISSLFMFHKNKMFGKKR